jgi:hypothetical protein
VSCVEAGEVLAAPALTVMLRSAAQSSSRIFDSTPLAHEKQP